MLSSERAIEQTISAPPAARAGPLFRGSSLQKKTAVPNTARFSSRILHSSQNPFTANDMAEKGVTTCPPKEGSIRAATSEIWTAKKAR